MRGWLIAAAAAVLVGLLGVWVFQAHPAEGESTDVVDPSRPRPQGDVYVMGAYGEPQHLNPLTTSDSFAQTILSFSHEALLQTDPATGERDYSLVSEVEPEDGGLAFVLRLRPDVRFSDGAPLGMEDVLFTWELARAGYELPGARWFDLRRVASVEQLDGHRLRVELNARHFAGLDLVGKAWVVVQRRHFEDEVRRQAERAGEEPPTGPADPAFGRFLLNVKLPGPGTGPYRLARSETGELLWRKGVDLRLSQNPHAWRRSAYPFDWNLAGIKLVFLHDPAAQTALLRQQAIDSLVVRDADLELRNAPDLAEHYDAYDYAYLTLGPVFVVWRHDHPALGDRRVRRALTMLFDREALVRHVGTCARPAASWFAPGSARAGALDPLPHDVDAAMALLQEAGWGRGGKPLELTVLTIGVPMYEQIIDLARPAFARAGIQLHKKVIDYAVLESRIAARDFEGVVYAWNPDVFNDPAEIFHSTIADSNWMRYADTDMDRVLVAAREELDGDKRLELYREFNRVFQRDQPITLLYHRRASSLLHKRFQNVEVGAFGLQPRRWWVRPEDRLHR